jgi:hypothetical protein
MYHVLVKMVRIFDTQQTWIDARKISYSSNLVVGESDKGLYVSNPPLILTQQKDNFLTHFISGELYKVSICDNL